MPVHIRDLIEVLAEICQEKDLKCTINASAKGGVVAGLSALVGGLLLGRVGIALGAAVGGLAYASASNSFKPVAEILIKMPEEQKRKLANKVLHAFKDFGIHDLTALLPLLLNQTSMKEIALREITNYLRNEMNLSVY